MDARDSLSCTAFAGSELIASGSPQDVALACKALLDAQDSRTVLVFDDATARPVEFDLRGSEQEVSERLTQPSVMPDTPEESAPRSPGRPKLGVVGREVTLLPRHWEWLGTQSGGASVALRRLVEQAIRDTKGSDEIRHAQEVTYRFMSAIAGDEPGYEEAVRALYACDWERFEAHTDVWPADIRLFARGLASGAFGDEGCGASR